MLLKGHFPRCGECPFSVVMVKNKNQKIKRRVQNMNSTAVRAEAQSANNKHMVFNNEEHEKFYYEKLEQARYQDCYHKALIYILGISEDTRNHFSQIYDIKSGFIKPECLHQGWQTSGSVRVVRLAFNLYTDGTPSVDNYRRKDEQIRECKGISGKCL